MGECHPPDKRSGAMAERTRAAYREEVETSIQVGMTQGATGLHPRRCTVIPAAHHDCQHHFSPTTPSIRSTSAWTLWMISDGRRTCDKQQLARGQRSTLAHDSCGRHELVTAYHSPLSKDSSFSCGDKARWDRESGMARESSFCPPRQGMGKHARFTSACVQRAIERSDQ